MNATKQLATRTCEACGSQVMPALIKCPDCGTPLNQSHAPSPPPQPMRSIPATVGGKSSTRNDVDTFSDMLEMASSVDEFTPLRQVIPDKPHPHVSAPINTGKQSIITPAPHEEVALGTSSRAAANASVYASDNHSIGAAQTHKQVAIRCECGQRLRIPADQLGKRIRCPACQNAIQSEFALDVTGDRPAPNPVMATIHQATSKSASQTTTASESALTLENSPFQFFQQAAQSLPASPILAPPDTANEIESTSTTKKNLTRGQIKKYLAALEIQDPGSQNEAAERRQALLHLGEHGDAALLEDILKVQGDPWVNVREAVATAIGNLRDPRGTPYLVSMLGDPALEVCRASVTALGKIGDGRAVEALVHLSQFQPHRKAQIAESINGMNSAALPGLLALLKNADPGIVLEAIVLLGHLKHPDGVEPLIAILQHASSTLRAHAAESLGKIGDARAVPALCQSAADKNLGVRLNAIAALAKIADHRAEKVFLDNLRNEDEEIRLHALMGLGQIGNPRSLPVIIPLLADNDDRVRGALANAFGHLIDPRCIEPLLHLLQDPHDNVRIKAATALRKYHDQRISPFLIECLNDRNETVVLRAIDALGENKALDAVPALVGKLTINRSPSVRAAAAKALGEIGEPTAVDNLIEALKDEYNVRCRAIVALGEFSTHPKVLPALLGLLKDPIPEIRYHVAGALAKQENPFAQKAIEQLLHDGSPMVRRCAAKILADRGDQRSAELLKDDKILRQKPRHSLKSVASKFNPASWIAQFQDLAPATKGIVAGVPLLIVLGTLLATGIIPLGSSGATAIPIIRGDVMGLAFSPDGRHIAAARSRGLIEIWETAGTTPPQQFEQPAQGIQFSPHPMLSLLANGGDLLIFNREKPDEPPKSLGKFEPAIRALEVTPDLKHAMTWTQDGAVRIWNLTSNSESHNLRLPAQGTNVVVVDPTARFVVSGMQNGSIIIWDVNTKNMINQYSDLKSPVTGLAISRSGQHLAVGTASGGYFVWDLTTATKLAEWTDYGEVRYLSINSQRQTVLAVCDLTTIKLWNWTDQQFKTFSPSDAEKYDTFSMSPDEKILAVGGRQDSEIWLYDAEQGTLLKTLDVEP